MNEVGEKDHARTANGNTGSTPSQSSKNAILESINLDDTNDDPYAATSPYTRPIAHSPPLDIPAVPQIPQEDTPPNDWHIVDSTNNTTPQPSYSFPGTWPTALHDTSAAFSSVTAASASYATALSRSGLGRAGRSIGSALLASTNKGALSAADWAVERAGVTRGELPASVREWLESDEARKRRWWRRRGMDREKMSDEKGPFVLETREMDERGEFFETSLRGEEQGKNLLGDDEGDKERVGEEWEQDGLLMVFEYDE